MPSYTVKSGIVTDDATTPPVARKLARTSNGDLHCVWADQRGGSGSTQQIYYAKSTNEGETWVETALTSEGSDLHQCGPSITIDSNDHIHVVWYGLHSGSDEYYQIRYRKYTTSWQTIVNLTSDNYHQFDPATTIDSNNYIHVVWSALHSGATLVRQIRYIKYTTSWGSIQNLTNETTLYRHQNGPTIAVDSNNYIHIAWCGQWSGSVYSQIRYIKYTTSWGSIENLTSASYNQYEPSIAIDSNNYIHIAWRGVFTGSGNYYQIRHIKYTTSWGSIENLTNEVQYPYDVSCAIDSSNYIHIVWSARYSGSTTYYQIRYIKYTTSWGSIENLTSASDDQYDPGFIWASNPTVDAAKTNRPKAGYAFIWTDCTGTNSVKFYKSADLDWDLPYKLLSGAVTGQSTTSGAIKVTRGLTSTVTCQSTVSGLLIRCKFLAGTIDATLGVSGTLWRFVLFASTVGCESTTSGVLSKERRVAGTVSCESTTTGKLKTTSKIAGTIAAESITTGRVTGIWCIFGTAAAQSVVSGSMKVTWKLSGAVAGEGITTGLLKATRGIVGTTIATACSVGGAIKVTSELLGTVVVESVVSGNVTGASFYLVATVAASSTASGLLKRIRSVSRTTSMTSSLVGHLLTVVEEELAGSISSASTTSAVMKRTRGLTGTIAASCTVSGSFVTEMAGTIAISSTTSGKTKVVYKFTTTVTPESGVTGSLVKSVSVVGSVTGQSGITGLIKVTSEFIGTSSASSTVAGVTKVTRKLVGITIASTCVVTGDLLSVVFLVSTVSSQSTVGGIVKTSLKLRTTVACVSTVSGSTKATKKLVSVPIAAVLTMTGELAWPVYYPQFNIVSAINVIPIFAQDCRVNERLKRVSVTHGYDA